MLEINKVTETPKISESGQCWFCKETKPLSENLYVPLSFLTERNTHNMGSHKEIETKWLRQIISVPRCENCFQTHDKYRKVYNITRILIVTAFLIIIGLMAINAYNVSGLVGILFLVGISSFIFYILLKVLGKYIYLLIKVIANSLGWNTDRRCRTFPPIAEYLQQGWLIGNDPDVTPESDSV